MNAEYVTKKALIVTGLLVILVSALLGAALTLGEMQSQLPDIYAQQPVDVSEVERVVSSSFHWVYYSLLMGLFGLLICVLGCLKKDSRSGEDASG